jgi:uncharacterized LabA/DUF88 family protein
MGAKERLRSQATEAREEVEGELERLRTALASVEQRQVDAETAQAAEREARAVAEDLAQKVRRLEKLAGAADSLSAVQGELEGAERRIEELNRQLARVQAGFDRDKAELEKERNRARSELEELREELHRARRRITELESPPPQTMPPPPINGGPERMVLLLDQANLAATAAHAFGRKVNYSALLDQLRQGRKLERAVAFVVDNGGTAFDAFCDTLRRSGWDLRIKRPKRFADGRSKADWDMGIAMEAIELRDRAETLVLASGDGDFAPLLKRLQRWGQRVEVAAYGEGLANELKNAADRVIRLDESSLE